MIRVQIRVEDQILAEANLPEGVNKFTPLDEDIRLESPPVDRSFNNPKIVFVDSQTNEIIAEQIPMNDIEQLVWFLIAGDTILFEAKAGEPIFELQET